jgi:hypothetical protein
MSYEAPLVTLTRQKDNTFVEELQSVRKHQTEEKENVQPNKVQRISEYQSIKIQGSKHNEKGKENIGILERNEEKNETSKVYNLLVVNVKDTYKSKVIIFFFFIFSF